MTDPASHYDDVPYQSLAYPQSHPDRQATVAALFGLEAAPVTACRVLEIGCASGGNLLPMAATLPGSRFTGLDISPAQLAVARECVAGLPLSNVTLVTGSLADFAAEAGAFDYIIAHGVYSWVEAPLRAELLALCGRLLAPNGVAYVSYNTLPGCGLRQAMRQLTRLYSRGAATPDKQIATARNVFGLIGSAFAGRTDPHALLVQAEVAELRGLDDSYIAHEHLEGTSEACWFHEFAAAAEGQGLQYLGEAEVHAMGNAGLSPAAAQALRGTARDLIEAEQFLDFARNRSFRQTLLCRAGVPLKRSLAPGVLEQLRVASPARPGEGEPDVFRGNDGAAVRVEDGLLRAAMLELADCWPLPLAFAELAGRAAARAGMVLDLPVRRALALQLLGLCTGSQVLELQLQSPPFQTAITSRPEALPLARWQAQRGPHVVNGRHENVRLDAAGRALLPLLDGTRTVEELAAQSEDALALLTWFASAALLRAGTRHAV